MPWPRETHLAYTASACCSFHRAISESGYVRRASTTFCPPDAALLAPNGPCGTVSSAAPKCRTILPGAHTDVWRYLRISGGVVGRPSEFHDSASLAVESSLLVNPAGGICVYGAHDRTGAQGPVYARQVPVCRSLQTPRPRLAGSGISRPCSMLLRHAARCAPPCLRLAHVR